MLPLASRYEGVACCQRRSSRPTTAANVTPNGNQRLGPKDFPDSIRPERSEAGQGLPVFQAHGLLDPMVVPDRGTAARDVLQTLGHPVTWSSYPMGHEVCLEEIRALGLWLHEVWTD